eukprot:ANDGO_06829.mRNA.1 Cytochrome b5 domain-containing protein RLF
MSGADKINTIGWLNEGSPQLAAVPGKPREKVALKPGHGLVGWQKLNDESTSLSGVPGGRWIRVPMSEVKKHNTREDAWTVIRGKIYNIAPYLDYHPGGPEKLMMVAGKEGSSMFDKYHAWVNIDSLMQKSMVGFLVDEEEKVDVAES